MRGRDFRFSRKTANSRARFARVFYENIALAKAFLKKRLKTHFAFCARMNGVKASRLSWGRVHFKLVVLEFQILIYRTDKKWKNELFRKRNMNWCRHPRMRASWIVTSWHELNFALFLMRRSAIHARRAIHGVCQFICPKAKFIAPLAAHKLQFIVHYA